MPHHINSRPTGPRPAAPPPQKRGGRKVEITVILRDTIVPQVFRDHEKVVNSDINALAIQVAKVIVKWIEVGRIPIHSWKPFISIVPSSGDIPTMQFYENIEINIRELFYKL